MKTIEGQNVDIVIRDALLKTFVGFLELNDTQ